MESGHELDATFPEIVASAFKHMGMYYMPFQKVLLRSWIEVDIT
jgi:hypothetical protein